MTDRTNRLTLGYTISNDIAGAFVLDVSPETMAAIKSLGEETIDRYFFEKFGEIVRGEVTP